MFLLNFNPLPQDDNEDVDDDDDDADDSGSCQQ
jgi:hypothetical protein